MVTDRDPREPISTSATHKAARIVRGLTRIVRGFLRWESLLPHVTGLLVVAALGVAVWALRGAAPWHHLTKWQFISGLAVVVSAYCANYLYWTFPALYNKVNLQRGIRWFVFAFVPILQALAVIVALIRVGDTDHSGLHEGAVAFYLLIFIVWDAAVWWGVGDTESQQHPEAAKRLKDLAGEYVSTVDLPTFVAFFAAWLGGMYWGLESPEIFMAGVVGSQALAGLTVILVKTYDTAVRLGQAVA